MGTNGSVSAKPWSGSAPSIHAGHKVTCMSRPCGTLNVRCRKVCVALNARQFDGVQQMAVFIIAAAAALGEVVNAQMLASLVARVRRKENT